MHVSSQLVGRACIYCVCMRMYVYVSTLYVCMYGCTHVYVCLYVCMYAYVCMYVHTCTSDDCASCIAVTYVCMYGLDGCMDVVDMDACVCALLLWRFSTTISSTAGHAIAPPALHQVSPPVSIHTHNTTSTYETLITFVTREQVAMQAWGVQQVVKEGEHHMQTDAVI